MTTIVGPWAAWGVFFSFLIALASTVLLFRPSIKGYSNALLVYRVIAVVALILSIPGMLISPSLNLGLADLSGNATNPLVWVSLLAGVAALMVLLLTVLGVGLPKPSTGARPTLYTSTVPSAAPPSGFTVAPPPPMIPVLPQVSAYPLPNIGIQEEGNLAPTALDRGPEPSPSASSPYEPEAEHTLLLGPQRDYFAWLVELTGSRAGTAHRLAHQRIVLGRGTEAGIKVGDPSVSSEHAVLILPDEAHHYVLHDLASSNGTFIRGRRVEAPYRLTDGDVVELGESRLYFMEMHVNEAKTEAKPLQIHTPPEAPLVGSMGPVVGPTDGSATPSTQEV